MKPMTIKFDDKPNLTRALMENPELAKTVIRTFVQLMEESFDESKGIMWAELAGQLHKDLTFPDLVKGVLRGALDVKAINPDTYDALQVEVHPLSILQTRKNWLDDGKMRYVNWRAHFRLPEDTPIGEEAVTNIIRTLLRHAKFVKIDQLREAMEANQVATYRGIGDVQMKKLPFYPAMRYQNQNFGQLHVGKMNQHYGTFDCGQIDSSVKTCPACNTQELEYLDSLNTICRGCNAGFVTYEVSP